VTFIGSKKGPKQFPLIRNIETPAMSQPLANTSFLNEVYMSLMKKGVKVTGLPEPGASPTGMQHDHLLVQVASLVEVNQWLAAYSAEASDGKSLRIQFVGHSVSGALSLGGTWIDTDKERYAAPFYVLDSSPRPLRGLNQHLGSIQEVMLAGCYIASRVANGNPVNGRTLLFTLAEMWHCKVRGANTSVSADDFDRHGWYVGNRKNRPVGWAWHRDHDPVRTTDENVAWDPDASRRLAAPSNISSDSLTLSDTETAQFATYFDAELSDDMKPRLRVCELALKLRYGDRIDNAQLTCNGQFLEILSGPNAGAVFANWERRQSDDVSRLVARMSPSLGEMA
jgi:hypothetical protein